MVSKPTSCRCCRSPLGPQDTRFSGPVSPPWHRSGLEALPKPQHPSGARRHPACRPSSLTPGLCVGRHSGVKPGSLLTAQAREERETPPFCRQLRPACPTELSPMPTAFKDSCLPPLPSLGGFGGVSAPWFSASPLTFLLNSFHQLHQQRWRNLRRAELLLQVWERRPWGRGRERRGQPQLSPQQTRCSGAGPGHNQRCSQQQRPRARKAMVSAVRPQPTRTLHGGHREPLSWPRNRHGTC